MLLKFQWYNIGQKLVEFLGNYTYSDGSHLFEYLTDRENLKIQLGTGNAGEYPAIWVLFGEEMKTENTRNGNVIQFWIDVYTTGEAVSETPIDNMLYKQASQLENELATVLFEFDKILHKEYGIATNMKIRGVLSDGDENAPVVVQHRIVLDIEWYKYGNR